MIQDLLPDQCESRQGPNTRCDCRALSLHFLLPLLFSCFFPSAFPEATRLLQQHSWQWSKQDHTFTISLNKQNHSPAQSQADSPASLYETGISKEPLRSLYQIEKSLSGNPPAKSSVMKLLEKCFPGAMFSATRGCRVQIWVSCTLGWAPDVVDQEQLSHQLNLKCFPCSLISKQTITSKEKIVTTTLYVMKLNSVFSCI